MSKILLIVTGGISAYKAAGVASYLRKRGDELKIIMTNSAQKIITPLTLESVGAAQVYTDLWHSQTEGGVEHIELARWADIVMIVPATYNFVGKVAAGLADDLASVTLAATTQKCIWYPAMNSDMYANPIYQQNQQKLQKLGHIFIEPESGLLACGLIGPGRLPELDVIIAALDKELNQKQDFAGQKILITAGPTLEKLDDIRFLSNRSSGKMGYAIAQNLAERGAEVTLISGPTKLARPNNVKEFIAVESAAQMYDAVFNYYKDCNIAISVAAVADYTIEQPAKGKIKKSDDDLSIKLSRTKDILKEMGKQKQQQFLVGFAAESENGISNAQGKMQRKNLDMIVLNHVSAMQSAKNAITILTQNGQQDIAEQPKEAIAQIINDAILNELKK